MRHYLVVGDAREVLGVWEAADGRAAERLRLELSLSYPSCRTLVGAAADYETFKAGLGELDFDGVEPEGAPTW